MFGGHEECRSGQNFLQWTTLTLLFCFLMVPQEKNAAGKAAFLSLQRQASKKVKMGDFMPVQW